MNCSSCHHPEAEHHGLGCRHENYTELRRETDDGLEIRTDLSLCGCPYFR